MSITSFIVGFMAACLIGSFFNDDKPEKEEVYEDEIKIHDYPGRKLILSCQTCRKLKNHMEVEPGLFQCVKCKRKVDIRVS